MDYTQKPRTVTGQLQWGDASAAQNVDVSSNGPLTGKPVETAKELQKSEARSSRRSRKSDSAFRTISEVAEILDVQQHVLRFWETKFSKVRPLKRGGGRRYYRPEDVALLQKIHYLLYTEGYTIKGVQKLLKEQGKKAFVEAIPEPANVGPAAQVDTPSHYKKLQAVLDELKDLRELVSE